MQVVAAAGAAASEPLLRLMVCVPIAAVKTGTVEALQVVVGSGETGVEVDPTISRRESKISVNVIPVSAAPLTGFVMVNVRRLAFA